MLLGLVLLAIIVILAAGATLSAPTPPGPAAVAPGAALSVALVLYIMLQFLAREILSTPMVVRNGRLRLRCRIEPRFLLGLLYDPPWKTLVLAEVESASIAPVPPTALGAKHLLLRTRQGGEYWFDEEELALYKNADGETLDAWLLRHLGLAPGT